MTEKEQIQILELWLGKHKGLLFKIVRAYSFTPMDQEDLFQEIVIQVWHSIKTFRHACAVTTWLYRIALNTAIRWNKREKKNDRPESLDRVQYILEDNMDRPDERLDWLYTQIHQLDEIDRSLTLLMLDGLSYKEMAGILGITESHVGVKINRIKKLLIEKSKSYDYGI